MGRGDETSKCGILRHRARAEAAMRRHESNVGMEGQHSQRHPALSSRMRAAYLTIDSDPASASQRYHCDVSAVPSPASIIALTNHRTTPTKFHLQCCWYVGSHDLMFLPACLYCAKTQVATNIPSERDARLETISAKQSSRDQNKPEPQLTTLYVRTAAADTS